MSLTVCEPAVTLYVVVWRRRGGRETFRHRVAATCEEEAYLASSAEIHLALGPNSELWELEDVAPQMRRRVRRLSLEGRGV